LYLARNLLREDGVIFISIDDNEISTLKALVNEVFGEENFTALFVWEKRTTRENRRVFSFNHEYVLCVARYKAGFEEARNLLPLTDEVQERYSNPDNDPRGPWQSVSLNAQAGHATKEQFYSLTTPGGRTIDPPAGRCWVVTKPRMEELIADNRVWFGESGNNVPRRKAFRSEANEGLTPHTLWTSAEIGTNDSAKKELIELFGGISVFETPKPPRLVRRMMEIGTEGSDIVLDFFAGSGTTAHAVLDQNKQDGGNRKFILGQLPEPTERKDYPTIADITKERVRRVIQKLNAEDVGKLDLEGAKQHNRGFRGFKLAESNFKPWNAEVPYDAPALEKQLELHVEHIREERTAADLLYEILLKSGFPLTTPVETLTLPPHPSPLPQGERELHSSTKTVYSVAGGALFICLERALTLELIRTMADKKPERVVCLDEGFAGNDQLKTNTVQIFKTKGVTSFRTV
jgi:adenine-specific DNA-methyltransferase